MATKASSHPADLKIEGYKLFDSLGEGASGVVYRAHQSGDVSRNFAIKISKTDWDTDSVENRIRFENEAEFLSRLSHPSIVKLVKVGVSEGHFYLVMEFVDGRSLAQLRTLGVEAKAEIFKQIALGLAHAHSRGIVHRDIKPSNVLVSFVDAVPHVKILDFGLSGVLASRAVNHGAGTLLYLAPEQLGPVPQAANERSDLYSLGMLAFELFSGTHPFRGLDVRDLIDAQIHQTPESPAAVPKPIAEIIDLLLKKDPSQRYETAKGVASDLQIFLERFRAGKSDSFELRREDRPFKLNTPKFLGRANERNRLAASYAQAKEGKAAIVTLGAMSGTGKSRLLLEVIRKWPKSTTLWGVGRAYGQSSAYGLFAKAFQDLLSQRPDSETRHAIRAAAGELGSELVRLVPEFREILGESAEAVELEPERRQQRFFAVVADVVRRIATPEAPLVLVFDDIQWADEGSLQLILHLASQAYSLPLLIIVAYRSEEAGPDTRTHRFLQKLQACQRVSSLNLEPLSDDEIGALTFSMLGKKLPEVDAILKSQSNGSPLFAIELLYVMVETGVITLGDSGWKVTDTELLNTYSLTDGLATTIAKRFERLSDDHRLLMQLAAVAGRSFSMGTIVQAARARLGKSHDQCVRLFLGAVREGLDARLITPGAKADEYEFSHDKIRESLYERLSPTEVRVQHRIIAEAIRATSTGSDESVYELAHHFLRSDDIENAVRFAIDAGALACRQLAYREALDYFEFAETQFEGVALKEPEKIRFLENFAEALSVTGNFDGALDRYRMLQSLLSQKVQIGSVLQKMGKTLFTKGEPARACVVLEEALEVFGQKVPKSRFGLATELLTGLSYYVLSRVFRRQRPVSDDPVKQMIGRTYSQLT